VIVELKFNGLHLNRVGYVKWDVICETLIHTVILQPANNLIFSFQVKKSKKRSFGLRPQNDTERQAYKNFRTLLDLHFLSFVQTVW